MALTGKLEGEVELGSPAAKFFNLFTTQLYDLPNISDLILEIKLIKGDLHSVSPDSVSQWTYTLIQGGKVETCKGNFEEIDNERKAITFNLFDGDVGDKYKSLKVKLQVIDEANNNNNCALAKWTIEYEKLREDIPSPQGNLDFVSQVSKDVDAHLIKA